MEERARASAARHGIKVQVQRVGSMFTFFFTDQPVVDLASARSCDTAAFGRFFQGMLDRGVYLPPSQFEAAFLSAALGQEDLEVLARAIDQTFQEMASA